MSNSGRPLGSVACAFTKPATQPISSRPRAINISHYPATGQPRRTRHHAAHSPHEACPSRVEAVPKACRPLRWRPAAAPMASHAGYCPHPPLAQRCRSVCLGLTLPVAHVRVPQPCPGSCPVRAISALTSPLASRVAESWCPMDQSPPPTGPAAHLSRCMPLVSVTSSTTPPSPEPPGLKMLSTNLLEV